MSKFHGAKAGYEAGKQFLGKLFGKGKVSPTIKSFKPADRLTERRKNTEDLMNIRKKFNIDPKKANIASSVKKTSALNEKYDAAVRARKKKIKSDKKKAFGAAATVAVGATGAHGVAKKKFPKYKEVMESNITIKDGKLKLKKKEK
mgnify:CR=1 FL=1|tara:strand:- start:725 stop:1162 length:438 start_codon:yes stop_codon:yes gene_type:complete